MRSPQDVLAEAGITYIHTTSGKFTAACPQCGQGYCNVKTDAKGAQWFCQSCKEGGGRSYEERAQGLPPIKAIYDYTDEDGARLYQAIRFDTTDPAMRFRQRRDPDQKPWSIKGVRLVPFMLHKLVDEIAEGQTIHIAEGEKDVLTLRKYGFAATCNAMGALKWQKKWGDIFNSVDVVIIGDNDDPGRDHVEDVARKLKDHARRIRVLDFATIWPDIEESQDVSDWFAAGGTAEELEAAIEGLEDWHDSDGNGFDPQAPPREPDACTNGKTNGHGEHAPCTIDETLDVFARWLLLEDLTPVYAVLGTVAANLLPGAPVWLGLVAPPSSAKTEILNSVSRLPNIVQAATLTPAGLLSGTPKKQRDKGAKGGLLRQMGDFGIIVLKDFGSILSMRFDARAEVLAALREIYDGAWTRHLGTDGGKTLEWSGKAGLVFGVTGALDAHYAVIGTMGDRFLLNRLGPVEHGQFDRALRHVGAVNEKMRTELGQAVARLFAGRKTEPRPISADEIKQLDDVLMLIVRLRGAVERDRYSREVEAIYGVEGTARIGLMLERFLAGLHTLGVDRATSLKVVTTIAMDSVPPLRRRAYEHLQRARDLTGFSVALETGAIAKALGLPTTTVRRALEDLAAYRVIERRGQGMGNSDLWALP
jgi:hypothetical protein